MSQLVGVLFALAVLAGFATAVVLAIRRQKQRIAEKTQTLASLGYEVLSQPDSKFVERVTRLRSRWGRTQYSVRFCAVRKSWEHTSYVLDFWKRSGKNTRLAGENTMAFVSAGQQFPRFSLVPRPQLPGFVSGLMNTLAEKLLAQHGGPVQFPDDPSFADKFILAGEDHDAIRRLFTPQVRASVASHSRYHVEAEADMVVISASDFAPESRTASQDSLTRSVSEATVLFKLLART